jgi:hypothetical protein
VAFRCQPTRTGLGAASNYLDLFRCHIIPKWGAVALDDIKAVAVEEWLRSLTQVTPAWRRAIVEYALQNIAPIGVSTYRVTRELPAPIREEVPTVEDLEEVVTKLRGEMETLRRERQDEE